MIARSDFNGDGIIDYSEFLKVWPGFRVPPQLRCQAGASSIEALTVQIGVQGWHGTALETGAVWWKAAAELAGNRNPQLRNISTGLAQPALSACSRTLLPLVL